MTRSSARSASSTPSNHRGKPAAKKSRKHIQLDSQGPFSDAVIVGDMLYLSGCIGLDEFKRVPMDIDTEARNLMENVRAVLQKAGMQLDDLVYVQVFCTDVSLWERFNRIYRSYFTNKMPARAFIGSGRLLFGAHFEVQGIAIKSA